MLAGIWILFALLYTQVGFVRWEPKIDNLVQARAASSAAWIQPLRLTQALGYSAAVMTLQKPEPRPSSLTAKNLVLFGITSWSGAGSAAGSGRATKIHADMISSPGGLSPWKSRLIRSYPLPNGAI